MRQIILVLVKILLTTAQDVTSQVDVQILTELPLEKLLQVRNTFETVAEISAASNGLPEALPLQGKPKPNDRGGYHDHGHHYVEEYSKKSGKKSVQSIFQLSVTTLAFLAFGGYLLCLLCQAIRSKDDINMMNTQTMAAIINTGTRRRRPTRRPNKYQRPSNAYKRKPVTRPKRDIWPNPEPEEMYHALLTLSEAYATYHTIDYRRFNYTRNNYFN